MLTNIEKEETQNMFKISGGNRQYNDLLSRLVKKSVLDDQIVSSEIKKLLPDGPDDPSRHMAIYPLLGTANKPLMV